MLHDVVVHIANEQPVMVDLIEAPSPSDVAVICTNMRTMNGKKPVFVDKSDSVFIVPLVHIRFVEVPRAQMDAFEAEEKGRPAAAATESPEEEYGEPPLARLAWMTGEGAETADAAADSAADSAGEAADPNERDLWPEEVRRQGDGAGLDGDLLKRIRDV
jgi:hypothetical protein